MNDTLLTSAASLLQRDIEAVIRPEIDGVPVPVDTLWNPWTCPAPLLPWLAFAVSVVYWNSGWPEATKRQVIASSFEVHRKLGTVPAVLRGLADIGIEADLTEWQATEPAGPRGTFAVTAWVDRSVASLDDGMQRDAVRMVKATKRLSQHETVSVGAQLGSVLGIAAAAEAGVFLDTDAPSSGRDRATASLGLAAVADACVTLDTGAAVGGRVATGAILGLGGVVIPLQLTDVWG